MVVDKEKTLSLTDILSPEINIDSDPSGISNKDSVGEDASRYSIDVGALSLMIPRGILSEVIDIPEYTVLPLMPSTVVGLFNLRGNLVPIIDLQNLLELGNKPKYQHLIILGAGDNMISILIESLPYLVNENDYSSLHNRPKLPNKISTYVTNVFNKNGRILIEYEHDDFFSSLYS